KVPLGVQSLNNLDIVLSFNTLFFELSIIQLENLIKSFNDINRPADPQYLPKILALGSCTIPFKTLPFFWTSVSTHNPGFGLNVLSNRCNGCNTSCVITVCTCILYM